MKLYQRLAQLMAARANCVKSGNAEWQDKHTDTAFDLVKEHMPSGGGFDNGTGLTIEESGSEKLVFHTSFHHRNESGMYDGWTDHTIRVYPSLANGPRLTISGSDRNGIKDLIGDIFHEALSRDVEDGRVQYATQRAHNALAGPCANTLKGA